MVRNKLFIARVVKCQIFYTEQVILAKYYPKKSTKYYMQAQSFSRGLVADLWNI